MQLLLRCLDGATRVLALEPDADVAELQESIQASQGVPAGEQLLMAGGRLLSDGAASLAAAGLDHGCSVTLLLRLAGGKGGFGALLRGQGRDGKITDNFDACRDLSGRRIRHVEAEKKLKQWQAEAGERELEALAMKHMKEMAKQAKRHRDLEVNVEEVKRQHKEAADAVVDAVHSALQQGLAAGASSSGAAAAAAKPAAKAAAASGSPADSGSDGGSEGTRAAAVGSPSKAAAAVRTAAAGGGVRKRPTMLDMVEGESDDDDSSDGGSADE